MEEVRIKNKLTGGEKCQKPVRYDLIPVVPLEYVALVYGYGIKKYSERNWERGYKWSLSIAALFRHIYGFLKGEWLDPESKLPHLAHAVFHLFAVLEWYTTHKELNDLPAYKNK
ncbi:MAG: dATP/dGTP diphosphohydrolase domain-containing protein [Nanoarchaeota archaeon]